MSANDTYTIHMYSYDAYSDNTYTGMYGNNTLHTFEIYSVYTGTSSVDSY